MNTGIHTDDNLRKNSKNDSYKSQTLEYINFCQSKKVFSRLEEYYRQLLKDKNINLDGLFNNLEHKLNNSSNTIKFESFSKQLDI
jgi:BioD-like phosphotransacetylase family protein